ncbi:(2Fe-2S)-binding protein [Bacillus sp. CB102A.1]
MPSACEQVLSHTLGDAFDASAQSAGMCGCTTLSRDEVVAAIHEKGLKSPKEVRNVLVLYMKKAVQNVVLL